MAAKDYDSQLLESVSVRRRRMRDALLYGAQRARRTADERLGKVFAGIALAAVLCAGCVGWGFLQHILAKQREQQRRQEQRYEQPLTPSPAKPARPVVPAVPVVPSPSRSEAPVESEPTRPSPTSAHSPTVAEKPKPSHRATPKHSAAKSPAPTATVPAR